MADPVLVPANLTSIVVSALLYGVFFVLFVVSTYTMFVRARVLGRLPHRTLRNFGGPLMVGGVCFFVTVTTNWVMIVYRSFQGFIYYGSGTSRALAYYSATPEAANVKTIAWLLTLAVGDATLIYRLWVVWNRSRRVIVFPLITFCANAAVSLTVIVRLQSGYSMFGTERKFVMADWFLLLSTNLYCCGFITKRLWRMSSVAPSTRQRGSSWALVVFIESAALFVGWAILFLVIYETTLFGSILVEDFWAPISGIAFMLINARVGMGYTMHRRAHQQPSDSTSLVHPVFKGILSPRTPLRESGEHGNDDCRADGGEES